MDVKYFQAHTGYFWQWEDDEILAIPGGSTIAYRQFIEQVLFALADQGLPPFGALLLCIIATNETSEVDLSTIEAKAKTKYGSSLGNNGLAFLKLLGALPEKFKRGDGRIHLLRVLFFGSHNLLNPTKSNRLAKLFAQLIRKDYPSAQALRNGYSRDYHAIDLLGGRFQSYEAIMQALAKMPEIKEEIVLPSADEPQPKQKKDFVDHLTANHQTFYVGSLIRRLWSGLNIPVHNVMPSNQPLGGVSDLTNKGDFDRLLISEFANDDLVLMSRLANNEALYINREVPPLNNNFNRIILVDISLRNWGIPKTLGCAVALAISKHPKTDISCTSIGIGSDVYPLNLNDVDGVVDALHYLDSALTPVDGLEKFCKEFQETDNTEVIFVTAKETLRMPQMQKMLSDYHHVFNYWMYTDRTGQIEVYKKQHKSKKQIQTLQLPLEELWRKDAIPKPETEKAPVPPPASKGEVSEYPILFPVISVKRMMKTADGRLFCISDNNSLLEKYSNDLKDDTKGWILRQAKLVVGAGICEMGKMKNGDYVFALFNPGDRNLKIMNLSRNTAHDIYFHDWKQSSTSDFLFQDDHFYYFGPRAWWRIDPQEGKIETTQGSWGANLREAYNAHIIDTAALNKKPLPVGFSAYKYVKKVAITEQGYLVVNNRELQIDRSGILFVPVGSEIAVTAKMQEQNVFVFPDGSVATMNVPGMLVLHREMDNLVDITVSGLADVPRLQIVRQLLDIFSIHLRKVKEMVYGTDVLKLKAIPEKEARQFGSALKQMSGKVQVDMVKRRFMRIYIPLVQDKSIGLATEQFFAGNEFYDSGQLMNISEDEFRKRFLQPFIGNILKGEA